MPLNQCTAPVHLLTHRNLPECIYFGQNLVRMPCHAIWLLSHCLDKFQHIGKWANLSIGLAWENNEARVQEAGSNSHCNQPMLRSQSTEGPKWVHSTFLQIDRIRKSIGRHEYLGKKPTPSKEQIASVHAMHTRNEWQITQHACC